MIDLIDSTNGIHYALYRSQKIKGSGGRPDSFLACDDFYESRVENYKQTLQEDMQRKEDDLRQRFVTKVREKEHELREREEALNNARKKMMEELDSLRKTIESEEAALSDLGSNKSGKW